MTTRNRRRLTRSAFVLDSLAMMGPSPANDFRILLERAWTSLHRARVERSRTERAHQVADAIYNTCAAGEKVNANVDAIAREVRCYRLVRTIRNHNAHRSPIPEVPPYEAAAMLGPFEVSASTPGGAAAVVLGGEEVREIVGDGDINDRLGRHRETGMVSFRSQGEAWYFLDEQANEWVRDLDAVAHVLQGITPLALRSGFRYL